MIVITDASPLIALGQAQVLGCGLAMMLPENYAATF
jgi:hypothetical protein